jgi:hypothetical protein
MLTDEAGVRSYEDELLDMYDDAKVTDDIFELAEQRDEARDEGLGLSETTEEGSDVEQPSEQELVDIEDAVEVIAESNFDREHEGAVIGNILDGFSEGVPAIEASEHESEKRARMRRLQLQKELELQAKEAEEAQRRAAEKAQDDSEFLDLS